MSLRMQVEKKKAHEEMRRLMSERKKKDVKPSKIDNPLAKYNSSGQLMCILCNSIVRSENVWQVHINSKQHRENVEQAKKLKEMTNNFTVATKLKDKNKRPTTPPKDAPQQKKLKGILKNASQPVNIQNSKTDVPNIVPYHNEEIKRAPLNITALTSVKEASQSAVSSLKEQSSKLQVAPDQPIPEGFFDDPVLDAKVRNIEYKDPIEEEWEKFQKQIKEETTASAEIIAGEQEEATAERQIEEIDEQIRNWSRVLELELKKEETKKKTQETERMNDDDDSDNDVDIDEFLDWRAKKSYS